MQNIYINGASYCTGFSLDEEIKYKNPTIFINDIKKTKQLNSEIKKNNISEKSWLYLLKENLKNDYIFEYEIRNGKSFQEIYQESVLYIEQNNVDIYITIIPFFLEYRLNYYLLNKEKNKYENLNIMSFEYLNKIKNDYEISDELIDYFYFKDTDSFFINNFIKNIELLFLFINYLINKKILSFVYLDSNSYYYTKMEFIMNNLNEKEKKYVQHLNDFITLNVKGMIEEVVLNFNNIDYFDCLNETKHPKQEVHEAFYLYLKDKLKK